MSNYKLPRPPGEYRIGKYDTGECLYLITDITYTTWYNRKVNVRHVCIKNNKGLPLVDYPLSGTAKYKAFHIADCPIEWRNQVRKEVPEIYNQLWPVVAVKSEPTPDAYYIVKNANKQYRAVLRDKWDNEQYVGKNQFIFWVDYQQGSTTAMYNRAEDQQYWPLNNKKFPQLSSDVKEELQKLNPIRYREWEQFYMKKYPNFKPLREEDALKPAIDPSTMYIIHYKCNPKTLYLADRDEYNTSVPIKAFVIDAGYSLSETLGKSGHINKEAETEGYSKSFTFAVLPDEFKRLFKRLRPEIYKQLEQYYTAQEQTKVVEKQTWYQSIKFNPRSWVFAFGLNAGAFGAKIYLINILNYNQADCHSSRCLSTSNGQEVFMEHNKAAHRRFLPFEKLDSGDRAQLIKQSGIEFVRYCDTFYDSIGSGLDIDEKAMKADYQDTLRKIDQERTKKSLGTVMVFGTGTGEDKSNEALKEMFYNPSSYAVGVDPYKPTGEAERAFGIYSKGRRVGQSWANKSAEQQLWYSEYFKQHPRVTSDLSTAMGWALTAQNQQNNTPLKQQNNETIIVCRKVKPVIRCQTIRGTAAQSDRIEPAIATGHFINKSPINFSQKGAGGRKICVSVK